MSSRTPGAGFDVGVTLDASVGYPRSSPYHPDRIFPELAGLHLEQADPGNRVYGMVRSLLEDLGLDAARRGTAEWNPFSEFIRPHDRVLVKPNLVLHHNGGRADIDALVTHASVLRPVIDYALLALGGTGTVIVGDAPHGDADFDAIVERNGLRELVEWYRGRSAPVELRDFRKFVYPGGFSRSVFRQIDRDPDGYVLVDLGARSRLDGEPHLDRLYGSDYDRRPIVRQHADGHHRYLVAGSVLKSDVVISVPKLKTHKKTGVTINLKNLVGINGDKNYLAHFRIGPPSKGGDEYPDTRNPWLGILRAWEAGSRRFLLAPNKQWLRNVFRGMNVPFSILRRLVERNGRRRVWGMGNWHGNDTCWRMCLDLNYILRLADAEGRIRDTDQRRLFCLVDGILAGEGNGPLNPDPKPCGLLAAGWDACPTDYVCAQLMGLAPEKIALLREGRQDPLLGFDPGVLRVCCRESGVPVDPASLDLRFKPHYAWTGAIERAS